MVVTLVFLLFTKQKWQIECDLHKDETASPLRYSVLMVIVQAINLNGDAVWP